MYDGIIVTKIDRIIFVDRNEYPDQRTEFGHELSSHELILKLSGETLLHFGRETILLTPGTVYLLPKGDPGHYSVERIVPGDCIDIFFEAENFTADGVYVNRSGDNKKIESLFKRSFALWIGKPEGYEYECLSLLYRILAELRAGSYASPDRRALIQPAVDHISEHLLTGRIDLENLAQLCGISYSYFKRIFIERFGLPPKKYILRLQVNYAAELLSEGIYSVTRVAEMAGFSDVYYFSRVFKQQTGITPTEHAGKYKSSK